MTHHENLKVIVLLGPAETAKSEIVKHFTEKDVPKVSEENLSASTAIDQMSHLADAGQHRIIVDGISNLDEFKALRHAFPGEMTTIAIDDKSAEADFHIDSQQSSEDLLKILDDIALEIEF